MSDCLFCKIIVGEIPSTKIYEDAHVFCFLDLHPVNSGHTLVVPKQHYSDLTETPEEVAAGLMQVVPKLAKAIMQATGSSAFNIGVNNGGLAGQVIFHTHLHLMPRLKGDGFEQWPGKTYEEGEMERVGEKIRSVLNAG